MGVHVGLALTCVASSASQPSARLTLPLAIWTIGAFDSCVHMSEEAANAAKAVPLGILSSIGMCWGLGFVIVIVLAACMNQDVDSVLGSSFGQPVSAIRPLLCKGQC